VNEGYCNRISVRKVMYCNSATNSAGDHTQVIWHSKFTTVTRHAGTLLHLCLPYLFLLFYLFLVVSFILLVFSTYFLCFVIVLFVVSYGAEAWTLTKKEEQALLIFERKIFRRVYGA